MLFFEIKTFEYLYYHQSRLVAGISGHLQTSAGMTSHEKACKGISMHLNGQEQA